MARYAAFLRAINVGGRTATGEQLRSVFEGLGFEDVASFRNSGNVVFEAKREDPKKLVPRIETGLMRELGFEVPVFARSARQLKAIAAHEPFAGAATKRSKGKLQVILLARKPTPAASKKALQLTTKDDLIALRGTELYWLPSAGTQDSELDQAALAKIVGQSTTRTMGTVEQMTAQYFSDRGLRS